MRYLTAPYLRLFLILTEISGILVLIWYLRVPLAQKYLTLPPQNFRIETMESQKQYLLKQGDFISGKNLPGRRLMVVLTPDGPKNLLSTDKDGNFTYQIPQETKQKEYSLVIVNNDKSKPAELTILKVRIVSNNKLTQLPGIIR